MVFNIDNKKILKNLSKAFIAGSVLDHEKKKVKREIKEDVNEQIKEEVKEEVTEAKEELKEEAPEAPKESPKVKSKPKAKPKVPKPEGPKEFVTVDKIRNKRIVKIGMVAATKEHTKIHNVPIKVQDIFLRNAINDEPNYIYFMIEGSPFLHPSVVNESVKLYVDNIIKSDDETIAKLSEALQAASAELSETLPKQKEIEKKGTVLIRKKKKLPPPTNQKENQARKNKIREIKALKNELTSTINKIESLEGQIQGLNDKLNFARITANAIKQVRFVTKDARILAMSPFASWEKVSSNVDFRKYILQKWNNVEIPIKDDPQNEKFKLVYRPSSSNGIMLAKFVFPYSEEGNWKNILTSGFLGSGDTLFHNSDPKAVSAKKAEVPDLEDLYYVYICYTMGLKDLPPKTSENFPKVKFSALSNTQLCQNCSHAGHQTSKCKKIVNAQ